MNQKGIAIEVTYSVFLLLTESPSCIAESLTFGCPLEVSKKKGEMMSTCTTPMLSLMILGASGAHIGRYTCKISWLPFLLDLMFKVSPLIVHYCTIL